MVNFKKALFVLSFLLIEIQSTFAAGGISDLFQKLGTGFLEIFKSAEATYFFLVTGLFWALFVLMNSGLQKVPNLSGKPAKVISLMVTFMGVTLLVYGKSATDVIDLFKGSVGFFFSLVFAGIIIASSYWASKKFKRKLIKVIFLSWGIFIGTSFVIPIFDTFFGTVEKNLVDGASAVLSSILIGINQGSLLVGIVALVMLHIGWLNSAFSSSRSGSNKAKVKTQLKEIEKEFKSFNQAFKIRNKLISQISADSNTQNSGTITPSSTTSDNTQGDGRIEPTIGGNN